MCSTESSEQWHSPKREFKKSPQNSELIKQLRCTEHVKVRRRSFLLTYFPRNRQWLTKHSLYRDTELPVTCALTEMATWRILASAHRQPISDMAWLMLTLSDPVRTHSHRRAHEFQDGSELPSGTFQVKRQPFCLITSSSQCYCPTGYGALACDIITAWNIFPTCGPVAQMMSPITMGSANGKGWPIVWM